MLKGILAMCMLSAMALSGVEGVMKYSYPKCSVTCIKDAAMRHPSSLFSNAFPNQKGDVVLAKDGYESSLNVFLYENGGGRYLVDAGNDQSHGKLHDKLAQMKINPDTVDGVFITHIHPDHVGGLLWNGKALFPKAKIYIAKAEYDSWRKDSSRAALAKCLEPYAKRIVLFSYGKELPGGLMPMHTPGHTPGHAVYRFALDEEHYAYFVGDIMHGVGLQAEHPEFCAKYDKDPAGAVKARKEILALEAQMFGAHFPFPGMAVVRKGKYMAVPLPAAQKTQP